MKRFITALVVTISVLTVCVALLCFFSENANMYITNFINNVKSVKTANTVDGQEENSYFTTVDTDYFDDALFIGDSRTVGLDKYSGLDNADYFAKVGLTVYDVTSISTETNYGTLMLTDLLSMRTYKKVYIMFGVNELAQDLEESASVFNGLIDTVRSYQPDAIIFIEANLHVGAERSALGEPYSNDRLEKYNKMLSEFADNEKIFYIDVNEIYDDDDGNLAAEYTDDDLHLNGEYYSLWADWLCSNAVKTQ